MRGENEGNDSLFRLNDNFAFASGGKNLTNIASCGGWQLAFLVSSSTEIPTKYLAGIYIKICVHLGSMSSGILALLSVSREY